MGRNIKKSSNRLTRLISRAKIVFMNTKVMTPEEWQEIDSLAKQGQQARDEQIRKMRASDPKYWTF